MNKKFGWEELKELSSLSCWVFPLKTLQPVLDTHEVGRRVTEMTIGIFGCIWLCDYLGKRSTHT